MSQPNPQLMRDIADEMERGGDWPTRFEIESNRAVFVAAPSHKAIWQALEIGREVRLR